MMRNLARCFVIAIIALSGCRAVEECPTSQEKAPEVARKIDKEKARIEWNRNESTLIQIVGGAIDTNSFHDSIHFFMS